jgi:hypothetical protein
MNKDYASCSPHTPKRANGRQGVAFSIMGMMLWMFDQADMAKAKDVADDRVFIFCNMPSSISKFGTPQDLRDW